MSCGHAGGILLAAMENAELISVSCNHCGAPLPVAESTRFITCTFCGSNLEVHRAEGSAYTEVLHNIDQRTKKIEQDLHDLKRQSDLEQLDRTWMMRRDQLLVSGRRGSRTVPSMATGFIGMIFAVVFMLFWTAMAISHNAPFVFPLFGLIGIGVAIYGGVTQIAKAEQYAREEQSYLQQRRVIASRNSASA
jgi:uncharacterized Zn finger protein (UPF0148 family)